MKTNPRKGPPGVYLPKWFAKTWSIVVSPSGVTINAEMLGEKQDQRRSTQQGSVASKDSKNREAIVLNERRELAREGGEHETLPAQDLIS